MRIETHQHINCKEAYRKTGDTKTSEKLGYSCSQIEQRLDLVYTIFGCTMETVRVLET
jgi:hypothetical protein